MVQYKEDTELPQPTNPNTICPRTGEFCQQLAYDSIAANGEVRHSVEWFRKCGETAAKFGAPDPCSEYADESMPDNCGFRKWGEEDRRKRQIKVNGFSS